MQKVLWKILMIQVDRQLVNINIINNHILFNSNNFNDDLNSWVIKVENYKNKYIWFYISLHIIYKNINNLISKKK